MKDLPDRLVLDRARTAPRRASHEYQTPQSENATPISQQDSWLGDYAHTITKYLTVSDPIDPSSSLRIEGVEGLKRSLTLQRSMQDVSVRVSVVAAATKLTQILSDGDDIHDTAASPSHLVGTLDKLFRNARDETFEDGMDSSFSVELNHIIQTRGVSAITALEHVMHAGSANVAVVEEALRQIGYIDDAITHRSRLRLLERSLESPDARIRDAASIGIEAMNDPASISGLQKAIDREQHALLRQSFEDVLAQLQDRR